MLKMLVMVASIANCAGGVVLIATWAMMWQHVPIIVPVLVPHDAEAETGGSVDE